ncbi:hypothetical protein CC2G_002363 [Coprinopsis cinerea AmutBmut pab1-1]|nr:hypothetical protein CC2G_002363 [Coprinopsis cinerea AmutBmut pab1-1]
MFYFVLLITPEPSPGLLGFDLACVLAYADLRLPTSVFDHTCTRIDTTAIPVTSSLPLRLVSNPIDPLAQPTQTPPPPTRTVGACEVNHKANTILRPMLAGVRTQEELDDVVEDLRALKHARLDAANSGAIQDPVVLNPKGRPRNACMGYENQKYEGEKRPEPRRRWIEEGRGQPTTPINFSP